MEAATRDGTASRAAELEFRAVSKRYDGQALPAVRELSLTVPAGEVCVLVGPSGCGKTTIMRMVNRMIEPTAGDILLDGCSVRDHEPAELRRGIGYAIQQIGLFPHMKVGDNVATVPKLLGWERGRIRERVDELLRLVSLDPDETRDRYPAQLSGGQRQRVGVARALAADPPLLLMDEPFGAIDPINRARLQSEFLRLQRRIRKTVLFVTHDIDEALKLGDRIAVLKAGGIVAQYATPPELLIRPAERFVEDFVGADRALKRLGLERVRDVELASVPTVTVGELADPVRGRLSSADIPYALIVDEERRLVGLVPMRALAGERVRGEDAVAPDPTLSLDDVVRDALSRMLERDVESAPVVDGEGRVAGVLAVAAIGRALAREAAGAPPEPQR